MITYKQLLYSIKVYLNGKYVGTILRAPTGYYYEPRWSKKIGSIFSTIAEVLLILELQSYNRTSKERRRVT